jgi:hypothetical protein
LISTRDNISVNSDYPAISEFNSVISGTVIGSKAYLLDATDPTIPFGMLPFHDLNSIGWGRIVPIDKPSYWIKLVTPQKMLGSTSADLTFDGSALSGTITAYSKSFGAYERRAAIAAYKPAGDKPTIPGLTVTKAENNAVDPNATLTQTYQVQVNNQDKTGAFTFVPFMLGKPVTQPFELLDTLTTNPFVSDSRVYPVDFGMPSAYSFIFTLHLPAGYTIANPPQNITEDVDGIGSINAVFSTDQSTVTYTLSYNLDKAVYPVANYAKLKAFFDKIILAEKTPVTIKKQ